jgi:hypothetical protein
MAKKLIRMDSWKEFFQSTALVWAFLFGAMLAVAWFGMPLWGLLYFLYWLF